MTGNGTETADQHVQRASEAATAAEESALSARKHEAEAAEASRKARSELPSRWDKLSDWISALGAAGAAAVAIWAVCVAQTQLTALVADSRASFSYQVFNDIDADVRAFVNHPDSEAAFTERSVDPFELRPEHRDVAMLLIKLFNGYHTAYAIRSADPAKIEPAYWSFLTNLVCKTLDAQEYRMSFKYLESEIGQDPSQSAALKEMKSCQQQS